MGWPVDHVPPGADPGGVRVPRGANALMRSGSPVGWPRRCPVELRDEQLREALLVRCRAERIEPPGRVDRIVGSARAAFERRFCELTTSRLSVECAARLEALVVDGPGSGGGRGLLAELKADPGQVGLESLLREIDKLAAVRALGLPTHATRRSGTRSTRPTPAASTSSALHARDDRQPPESTGGRCVAMTNWRRRCRRVAVTSSPT